MNAVLLPKEFAQAVASHLSEPADQGSWFIDGGAFALVLKDGTGRPLQTLRLANFFRWYKEINSLDPVIQRVVALTRGKADTTNYDVVAPFILPKLFDRCAIRIAMDKARRDHGDAAPGIEMYVVGDVFAIIPVVDTGMTQEVVASNHLQDWGKSFNEVFDHSYRNLVRLSENPQFESLIDQTTNNAGIHESMWHDGYDASRLLIDEMIDSMNVIGDKLISMPTTSQLVISGSDDVMGRTKMLLNIEQAKEKDQRLPPFVLLHKDGKWSKYAPAKDSTEYDVLNRVQTEYWSQAYKQQKELLEGQAANPSEEVFIATYFPVQVKDGRVSSYATWTEGVPTLLPKTTFIAFTAEDKVVAQGSWERVQHIMKDSLAESDVPVFPPRFKTVGFPNKRQLQWLGMESF
jgi:hypothetical protein